MPSKFGLPEYFPKLTRVVLEKNKTTNVWHSWFYWKYILWIESRTGIRIQRYFSYGVCSLRIVSHSVKDKKDLRLFGIFETKNASLSQRKAIQIRDTFIDFVKVPISTYLKIFPTKKLRNSMVAENLSQPMKFSAHFWTANFILLRKGWYILLVLFIFFLIFLMIMRDQHRNINKLNQTLTKIYLISSVFILVRVHRIWFGHFMDIFRGL